MLEDKVSIIGIALYMSSAHWFDTLFFADRIFRIEAWESSLWIKYEKILFANSLPSQTLSLKRFHRNLESIIFIEQYLESESDFLLLRLHSSSTFYNVQRKTHFQLVEYRIRISSTVYIAAVSFLFRFKIQHSARKWESCKAISNVD